jgi:hypothetical protein
MSKLNQLIEGMTPKQKEQYNASFPNSAVVFSESERIELAEGILAGKNLVLLDERCTGPDGWDEAIANGGEVFKESTRF